MCGGRHWKNYWSLLNALDVRVERKPCVLLQCVFITLTVEAIMYCAYPVPGMGGNSLMYYYNGKSVSTLFGNVHARCRSAGGKCVQSVRLSLLVHLSVPYDVFFLYLHRSLWKHVLCLFESSSSRSLFSNFPRQNLNLRDSEIKVYKLFILCPAASDRNCTVAEILIA